MTPRILVVRLDSVGDVLLSGPAIRAIAARQDNPIVGLLCGPQGAPAARLLPGVGHAIVWNCPWISDPAPAVTADETRRLLSLVRDFVPDEAVILTSFHQSPLPMAMLLRLAGVARITGASVDHAGSLLDVRLRPGEDFPEDQPETERALMIAAAAGFPLPADDDGLLRVIATADMTHSDPRVSDLSALVGPGPYVVLHPGAAVPARAWPAPNFATTAGLLADEGVRVVVTGGRDERALTASVAAGAGRGTGGAIDLGGKTDLVTLAAVLGAGSALIAGNTGPAHLAAAVGTPVVSLFSPVVPAIRWAPYGVAIELLGDQHAPCRNTRARACPVAGHPCLSVVSPQEVVAACLRLCGDDFTQGRVSVEARVSAEARASEVPA